MKPPGWFGFGLTQPTSATRFDRFAAAALSPAAGAGGCCAVATTAVATTTEKIRPERQDGMADSTGCGPRPLRVTAGRRIPTILSWIDRFVEPGSHGRRGVRLWPGTI